MNIFCFKKIIQQIYLSTLVQIHIYDMVIGLIYVFLVSSFQDIHNKSQIHPEEKKGGGPSKSFICRATLGEILPPASRELGK